MNTMENRQHIRQTVDRYMKGELTTRQVDALWEDVLKYPELLEEMEAEAAARLLLQSATTKESGAEGVTTRRRNGNVTDNGVRGGFRMQAVRWMAVAAMVLLMAVGLSLIGGGEDHVIPSQVNLSEMVAPELYRDNQVGFDEADVWMNEGVAQALRGYPDRAVVTFEELLARDLSPMQHDAARFNLSILLYNAGAYHDAAECLEALLEASHSERSNLMTGRSWALLGMSQARAGRTEEALVSFDQALSHELPSESVVRRWVRELE